MARVLADFANEALGYVRDLPYLAALSIVQDAWREIRDSRRWSFLRGEAALIVPASITAGTVTVSQFNASVVGNAAAKAAWDAAGQPVITERQFRLASGPIYNITAYDSGTGTLTLDRQYAETSAAGVAYQVYRCYYKAPVQDFLKWVAITNVGQAYRFRRRNLYRTKEEVDRRDPQRTFMGNPYWAVAYKIGSDGYPYYELWPHATSAMSFHTLFQRRGTELTASENLPAVVPEDLLADSVRLKAYEWALTNNGKSDAWTLLFTAATRRYKDALRNAQIRDEEMFPQNYSELEEDVGYVGPIDAAYLQTHDMMTLD